MIQYILTPSAGKRLIAKATIKHNSIQKALKSGTIVIIAGTTNGYIAEELLTLIGENENFNRKRFFRGVTLPPQFKTTDTGRLPDETQFPCDVVIKNGEWLKGKTIFDVIDTLEKDDVIVKGANCVNLKKKNAGILIGHPTGGTITVALQAVLGKRTRLLHPVGLEKRVSEKIDKISRILNSPDSFGPRFLPVPGEVITELDAISILSSAEATLVAGGGVCGAEGAVWISIDGEKEQIEKAKKILDSVANESPFLL